MRQARWTAQAALELEEILFYIALEAGRPNVAERLDQKVRAVADRLANNPLLGEAWPDLGSGLRVFSFKRWAVIYRASDTGVDIVGFVDAARDFGDFFRGR
jgi:plasmid stabilization system protein ParE